MAYISVLRLEKMWYGNNSEEKLCQKIWNVYIAIQNFQSKYMLTLQLYAHAATEAFISSVNMVLDRLLRVKYIGEKR